jgi:hypothetical protein
MANTVIQLKYSTITNKPPTLNVAEPAYSNVSSTLWIDDGTGVVAIGGKAYTDKIDAAASAATANVLVKRDTTGNASFNYITANIVGSIFGNATSADKWFTARDIGVSGDATGIVSVNGTVNANIPLVLSNSGVAAGNYGSVTQIPTFAVDSKGRITSASNVSISTTLNIAGDTGTDAVALATDTITIKGGDGITSGVVAANTTVILDVDTTVLRSNTAILNQTIDGSITITGNLIVTGNTTTVDVTTLSVEDSLIALARNNITDSVDIGFYGHYNDTANRHAGIMRHAGDKQFYVFDNYDQEPTANTINPADASFRLATLNTNLTANIANATVATIGTLTLTNDLTVPNGGTGAGTFATGSILVGDGTNSLKVLANTGTAGAYGSASNTLIVTTDAYGRVSAITNSAIQIDASNIVSGNLAINRGGTNNDSYTTGAAVFYDGTAIKTLANTGTAGAYGSASYVPIITTDALGRVSGVSNTAINIDTSAVVSGTLGIARGGSGASSFAIKGVIVSDAASTTGALASLTSPTEGHLLQINSSGAPTFAHLNGGSF